MPTSTNCRGVLGPRTDKENKMNTFSKKKKKKKKLKTLTCFKKRKSVV
jgi:hypothetical protein